MPPQVDLVRVIESIYRVEVSEEDWLGGILTSVRPLLDEGLGVSVEFFDASRPGTIRRKDVQEGYPPGLHRILERMLQNVPPPAFEAGYRGDWQVGCASAVPGFEELPVMKQGVFPSFGIQDCFFVKSAQPGNIGCQIAAFRSKRVRITQRDRALWSRVAAHLGAGYRMRQRLNQQVGTPEPPEAVLDATGRTHHAEGAAKTTMARENLKHAVLALERARRTDREDALGAMTLWRALVSSRWTLLDQFDSDGRRYIVARENEPLAPHHPALTSREQQVASFACLGYSNKVIAYHLGISHSTVRVLLARACHKLGVDSREALVRKLGKEESATGAGRHLE